MKTPVDPGSIPGPRIFIKMEQEQTEKNFIKFYNKNSKKLLIIPILLLILSIGYIAYFYSVNNDFIIKDVSLTGGTTITVFVEQEINIQELRAALSEKIGDFNLRELSNFRSGKQEAIIVESNIESQELKSILQDSKKKGQNFFS